MTKIEAIIERAGDGTYDIYCLNEIFSGAGKSIEDAKKDLRRQMEFYKETARKEGFKYPAFLDDEYEIVYRIDAPSLMKYYVGAGVFSLAGLEKVTGISQKQLWSYLNGTRPRRRQSDRIEAGFRALSRDLNALFA
ncbi:MAG: type II toxin-antitoxin system HicB family antitoxin [Bacteroidales bacterium]|nr:type II toxin-antitoxin system HicB family antitoxin [Bacteroidales bacterium]